jgi:hypothetical protein
VGLIVTLVVISLLLGTQLALRFGLRSATLTAISTIYTHSQSVSNVLINGTIISYDYAPEQVQFAYDRTCFAFCGFSTSLRNVSEVSPINGTHYYESNFSITVSNNENYLVSADLLTENDSYYSTNVCVGCDVPENSTSFFADYLPLNSSSTIINHFNIQCFSTNQRNYTSSPIVCQTAG